MSDDNKDLNPDGTDKQESKPVDTGGNHSETQFKELIAQRDKAKQERNQYFEELEKFKKAEQEQAQKKLEAEGNYQTIISQKESELESLKKKVDEQNVFVESLKKDLIEKLSEEHKAIAEKLNLDDLRIYVKLNSAENKVNTDNGKPGGGKTLNVNGRFWDDLNSEERKMLFENQYEDYRKLYFKKFSVYPTKAN